MDSESSDAIRCQVVQALIVQTPLHVLPTTHQWHLHRSQKSLSHCHTLTADSVLISREPKNVGRHEYHEFRHCTCFPAGTAQRLFSYGYAGLVPAHLRTEETMFREQQDSPRAIVVGGGIAGLIAAIRLARTSSYPRSPWVRRLDAPRRLLSSQRGA